MYPGIADRMQKEITALAPSTMKIKILPHQSVNTLSGSEAPSWPLCPPSSRCGSASRSTVSPAPPSSTANASKQTVPPPPPQPNAQTTSALCKTTTHNTFLIHTQAQSLDDQLIGMASVIFGA